MTRLTLDPRTSAELQAAVGAVEICDSAGRVLGVFTPLAARPQPASPYSDAVLQHRGRDLSGRSLQEIWQDLGSR